MFFFVLVFVVVLIPMRDEGREGSRSERGVHFLHWFVGPVEWKILPKKDELLFVVRVFSSREETHQRTGGLFFCLFVINKAKWLSEIFLLLIKGGE